MDDTVVRKVCNVRAALLNRLTNAIFRDGVAPERASKEINKIRVGDIGSVKLLALCDKEDDSTAADPLRAFARLGSKAGEAITTTLMRLVHVIQLAHPPRAADATPFIDELRINLIRAIDAGVPWTDISAYYRAVMLKVSTPARKFSLGQADGHSGVKFDVEWVTGESAAKTKLEQAIAKQVAYDAGKAGAREERANEEGGQPGATRSKRQLKKEEAAARKAAKAQKTAAQPNGVERAPGVDANASREPLPARGNKAAWDDFQKKHPPVKGADGKEKKVCWDFHHPQGCKRGSACLFAHK
jgi:hypothetical protein